jgi:hypothetical protein
MVPHLGFSHVRHMTDERGLFEHAKGTQPNRKHGYCTDDNARLLVLLASEPASSTAASLTQIAVNFVLSGQGADGKMRNRMDPEGQWLDQPHTDDSWGRSLWGLALAATATVMDPILRRRAQHGFNIGSSQYSVSVRSMVFATLGAVPVLAEQPGHQRARTIIERTLEMVGPLGTGEWLWPEERLRYSNAALAEAVIAGGAALNRPEQVEKGLAMLGWLLAGETRDGHLSVCGHHGRGPEDPHVAQFDQQPIEVAAMADACARAFLVTNDPSWLQGIDLAERWFLGDNDLAVAMHDPVSGGGFDGLGRDAVNQNQGAESTLAFLTTMQRAAAAQLTRTRLAALAG